MALNIVILGTAYPFRGGMAAFNERFANALLAEGNQVRIENFKLQYPNFLFPGKTQYSDGPAPKNLNIHSTVNSINPFNWFKIGLKLKKEKPDIVIIGYWLPFMAPSLGTIAKIIKSNKHTKIVSLLHNIIPHENRPGDKLLSRYFVKQNHGFISLSKSVLNDLKLFDKNKPRAFTPHPLYDHFGDKVDHTKALSQLKLNPENKHVLFFGLIRDYKGLDLLIDAFADERLINSNIKLIIAGEFYSNSEPYHAQIKKHKLKNQIILHDHYIPDSEVGLYFGAADIVAQPYKNATQSGVTQIGFHFEKPMLVTNVGGLGEIIPNDIAGYVVEPNAADIADKLVDFFKNDKYKSFENGVVEEKKKYSWNNMTSTLYELLRKIE